MAFYRVEWKRSAIKELRQIPTAAVAKIVDAVEKLASDPLPTGVRKLSASHHTFRIREGDYRVIYQIDGKKLIVQIVRVGHRREVYDR